MPNEGPGRHDRRPGCHSIPQDEGTNKVARSSDSRVPRRPAIDIVRDGVDRRTLSAEGDRAVWSALVSTATSWQSKNRTFGDWAAVVSQAQSNLGRQARLIHGRRERTPVQFGRHLTKAWQAAERFLDSADQPLSAEDFGRAAAVLRDSLLALAAESWPGDQTDRDVLVYVLNLATSIGTSTPTVPCRPAEKPLGCHYSTVTRALARLVRAGWLDLVERGRARGPAAVVPRASRYRIRADRLSLLLGIANPYLARFAGMSCTEQGMSCTTDHPDCCTEQSMSCTHTSTNEEPTMITITTPGQVVATLPIETAEIVARVLSQAGIEVTTHEPRTDDTEGASVTRLADHRRAEA